MDAILKPCPRHHYVECGTLCDYHPLNQRGPDYQPGEFAPRATPGITILAQGPVVRRDGRIEDWQKPDDSNPKDLIGLTKVPLRLVPAPALIKMAMVMGLGAKKYGPYNWREKKVRYTVYVEAALRHLYSALDGEEIDPESGQPHVAHAMACCAILLDAQATGNLIDDRPKAGVAAKLIAELTQKKA